MRQARPILLLKIVPGGLQRGIHLEEQKDDTPSRLPLFPLYHLLGLRCIVSSLTMTKWLCLCVESRFYLRSLHSHVSRCHTITQPTKKLVLCLNLVKSDLIPPSLLHPHQIKVKLFRTLASCSFILESKCNQVRYIPRKDNMLFQLNNLQSMVPYHKDSLHNMNTLPYRVKI